MWLITTTGFYSIVQKPGEKDLTIRSRVRKDLVALRDKYLQNMGEIVRNDNTDYRYRAKISHADLQRQQHRWFWTLIMIISKTLWQRSRATTGLMSIARSGRIFWFLKKRNYPDYQ